MRTYLKVPYAQKDEAKALGARWDKQKKKWYIPDGVAPGPFEQWMPHSIYLVLTTQRCHRCGSLTPIVAFGVPYKDDEGEGLALVPRFECVPHEIREFLADNGIVYKPKYSCTTRETLLNNLCHKCKTLQGEFFLFHEPDGPFYLNAPDELKRFDFYRVEIDRPVLGVPPWYSAFDGYTLAYAQEHTEDLSLEIHETLRFEAERDQYSD